MRSLVYFFSVKERKGKEKGEKGRRREGRPAKPT